MRAVAPEVLAGMILILLLLRIHGQRTGDVNRKLKFCKSAGGTGSAKKALHAREVPPAKGRPRIARPGFIRFSLFP